MIKIICKGYKYILKQLDDFSGVVSLAVISWSCKKHRYFKRMCIFIIFNPFVSIKCSYV